MAGGTRTDLARTDLARTDLARTDLARTDQTRGVRARVERARVYAALGDPVRLAMVEDLNLSDRSPSELGRRHGLASNLLAHHLDVLDEAGLISRAASSGDARRRYVRLIPERLDQVAMLPVLTMGSPAMSQTMSQTMPPAISQAMSLSQRPTVFLCTHNSARSQLAAALWERRTGVRARSAGTHPAPEVHRLAVEAGARHGLNLRDARPEALDCADLGRTDTQVITVCDRVHEDLDPAPEWWHWSIPDPVSLGTSDAFDAVIDALEERIARITSHVGS